ncbi:MAG: hypothetical protein II453_08390 [Alphaproteobacteria bacterium]|nr:hypothetical protein [Alphaproteobacteria bacterium]
MNANYLNVLAAALKTAIDERNGKNIAEIYNNLKTYKGENPEEAAKIQKEFNSNFSKLELAIAKQLTKTTSKNVGSEETAKNELRIMLQPEDVQRKKVKNMLSGYIASEDCKEFAAKFTKKDVLLEFDSLTDEEFKGLYRGATIQGATCYRVLVNRLEKASK